MKKLALLSLLVTLVAAPAWGTLVILPDSVPTGGPGSVIGWGYTATVTAGDTNFYVVTGIEFCTGVQTSPCPVPTLPGVASFSPDLSAMIFSLIFDVNGTYTAGNPYSEAFDALAHTGIGALTLDPGAVVQTIGGHFVVKYDIYDGDPTVDGSNQIGSLLTMDVNASFSVVPEPGTSLLLGAGLLGLTAARRRRTV